MIPAGANLKALAKTIFVVLLKFISWLIEFHFFFLLDFMMLFTEFSCFNANSRLIDNVNDFVSLNSAAIASITDFHGDAQVNGWTHWIQCTYLSIRALILQTFYQYVRKWSSVKSCTFTVSSTSFMHGCPYIDTRGMYYPTFWEPWVFESSFSQEWENVKPRPLDPDCRDVTWGTLIREHEQARYLMQDSITADGIYDTSKAQEHAYGVQEMNRK